MADTLKLIKALPPELQEQILKEHIKIKIKERENLGWGEVNKVIKNAPFCESNHQIVKWLYCPKCEECDRNDLCNLCKRNGVDHNLKYDDKLCFYYGNDYKDESFFRSWYNSWIGRDYSPWKEL